MKLNPAQKMIRGMPLEVYDHKLASLRQLSAELGVPCLPDIHIGVKVTSADGEVLEDRYEQGHSWTRIGWSYLHTQMMDSTSNIDYSVAAYPDGGYRKGNLAMRNTATGTGLSAGTTVALAGGRSSTTYTLSGLQGIINDATRGVTVGRSTIAFHGEDHELGDKIASGTGSGQFSYQAQTAPVTVYNSGAETFTCSYTRLFNNNSGAAIVVNEVGMVATTNAGNFLLSRDVLASPVNVPNGAQLTIVVALTTGSFSGLDTGLSRPALGASTLGGTFLGWVSEWASANYVTGTYPTTDNTGHSRYGLILSPKAGGESTALALRTSGAQTAYADSGLGIRQTAYYETLGATSPMGQFVTAANAANLGGYNDWYLPSYDEYDRILLLDSTISVGERLTAATQHWTATSQSTTSNYTWHSTTGAITNTGLSATNIGRLVRRALI